MQRFAAIIVIGIVLGLAACGNVTNPPDTFVMGAADFSGNTTLTIKAGQAVHFNNDSGSNHWLLVGMNGTLVPQNGAPAILNTDIGDQFNPNTNQSIIFTVPGTYAITCRVHPNMQVSVVVTP